MCARNGRGLFVVLFVAMALLIPSTAQASTYAVVDLDERSRAELLRLRDLARGAPVAEREGRWLEAARYALFRARSVQVPAKPDAKEVGEVLREAGERLPARALASLGGRHPAISAAFCRALARGHGPTGVTAAAEIAAEARDAIQRFGGGKPGEPFLDFLKKFGAPADGAGGAQRSVYKILVLSPGPVDSTSSEAAFARGLEDGLRTAAGAWADRFRVHAADGGDHDLRASFATSLAINELRPGVVVIAGGATTWAVASALGSAQGVIVADARNPSSVGSEGEFAFPVVYDSSAREVWQRSHYNQLGQDLGYLRLRTVDTPVSDPGLRPFVLRPTSIERGRRLAEVVRNRPELRKVAIALPERGGNLELAGGFMAGMRALDRDVELLAYEPGRRSFAPEAGRFVQSGAQAILFAGPGEESGEWLAALATRKQKPFVLGTIELDPAAFHASVRPTLEGAVLAAEDWEDRNAALVEHLRQAGEPAADPSYRRGYRFGWTVARSVIEGAWTPTSLGLALLARSHPPTRGQFARLLVGVDRTDAKIPSEVVLPLSVVKNGTLIPFETP